MEKPQFSTFTAQDARNIVEEESKVTLGKIIDAIRAGAKQGYESMNMEGADISPEILETLISRGFDIKDNIISWAIEPIEEKTLLTVVEDSEDIDNEPSSETEEE